MNLASEPTRADLAALLRQCNDNAGIHKMWVDQKANVTISLLPSGEPGYPQNWLPPMPPENVKFDYEAWMTGNDYVGAAAADDEKWVNRLFSSLQEHHDKGTERDTIGIF